MSCSGGTWHDQISVYESASCFWLMVPGPRPMFRNNMDLVPPSSTYPDGDYRTLKIEQTLSLVSKTDGHLL